MGCLHTATVRKLADRAINQTRRKLLSAGVYADSLELWAHTEICRQGRAGFLVYALGVDGLYYGGSSEAPLVEILASAATLDTIEEELVEYAEARRERGIHL